MKRVIVYKALRTAWSRIRTKYLKNQQMPSGYLPIKNSVFYEITFQLHTGQYRRVCRTENYIKNIYHFLDNKQRQKAFLNVHFEGIKLSYNQEMLRPLHN